MGSQVEKELEKGPRRWETPERDEQEKDALRSLGSVPRGAPETRGSLRARPCADFQPETKAGTTPSSQGRPLHLPRATASQTLHSRRGGITNGRSRSHSTEAVSRGLAVRADGTVSVLQGETKNDAQTKAKTTHTGDKYLRQQHPEELAKERGSAFVTSPARLSLWPWGSHRACLFSSICKISLLQ